jgi:hypothetical protein
MGAVSGNLGGQRAAQRAPSPGSGSGLNFVTPRGAPRQSAAFR